MLSINHLITNTTQSIRVWILEASLLIQILMVIFNDEELKAQQHKAVLHMAMQMRLLVKLL